MIAVDVAAFMFEPPAALSAPTVAFLATILCSAIRAPNRLTTLGEIAFRKAAPPHVGQSIGIDLANA
jgi:hypothetical protein